jgi:DTW domain-containing protein YfiP
VTSPRAPRAAAPRPHPTRAPGRRGRGAATDVRGAFAERCARCGYPQAWCVCDRLAPLEVRTRVLVLQHPQEPDVALGTARLLAESLPTCTLRVGLSWPSLEAALGDEPGAPARDRARWGVLYPFSLAEPLAPELASRPVVVLDRRGRPVREDESPLEGFVALDGTWSQAKSLWWRNPWMLKLSRVVVQPAEPGIYGRLRREPRRGLVSTLEAVADALAHNAEAPEVRDALRRLMRTMVQRARDASRVSGANRGSRASLDRDDA